MAIGLKLNAITTFDRSVIRSNWDKMNRGPLSKAANLVRVSARRSIKRRKNRDLHSPPGTPPFSHVTGKTPPFKMIYHVRDSRGRYLVGMVGFGGNRNPAPGIQEHGGVVKDTFYAPRRGAAPRRSKSTGKFLKQRNQKVSGIFNVQARPFMGPALRKTAPKLPAFWQNSLDRNRTRSK